MITNNSADMLYVLHPFVRSLNDRLVDSFSVHNHNKMTNDWKRHIANVKKKRRNKKKNR